MANHFEIVEPLKRMLIDGGASLQEVIGSGLNDEALTSMINLLI